MGDGSPPAAEELYLFDWDISMMLPYCAAGVDRPWRYTRRGTFHQASAVIVSVCSSGHGFVTPDELMSEHLEPVDIICKLMEPPQKC